MKKKREEEPLFLQAQHHRWRKNDQYSIETSRMDNLLAGKKARHADGEKI